MTKLGLKILGRKRDLNELNVKLKISLNREWTVAVKYSWRVVLNFQRDQILRVSILNATFFSSQIQTLVFVNMGLPQFERSKLLI